MQLARDNPHITIVGVGAGTTARGDSLDGAYTFVDHHGANLPNMRMLYDVSFRAWRNFQVTTQPWVILFDSNGNQIYNQPGRVDFASVAAALGGA